MTELTVPSTLLQNKNNGTLATLDNMSAEKILTCQEYHF